MAKKTEMIGFKTTPELKKALEEIAAKEDRSISYVINRILEDHVKSLTAAKYPKVTSGWQ